MFFQSRTGGVEYIIAGLGNPGPRYAGSRHNAGFAALDAAADVWGARIVRAKFSALTASAEVAGKKVLLIKPQTFMNDSGTAVGAAAAFYKIPPERIILLFDDISLAPGRLRIRGKGSAGGHNGVKSVIAAIGENFPRVKIGVGEKPRPEYDLADWVLAAPPAEEQKLIRSRFGDVRTAVELILNGKISDAMTRFNRE